MLEMSLFPSIFKYYFVYYHMVFFDRMTTTGWIFDTSFYARILSIQALYIIDSSKYLEMRIPEVTDMITVVPTVQRAP